MSHEQSLPVIRKVYVYILDTFADGDRLLVFEHVDFPEAGIQVPGGSVESGERLRDAAYREAREETGILGLKLVSKLGMVQKNMGDFGLDCIHERHYFQFDCKHPTPVTWISYEQTPSDGSQSPIALKFYWVELKNEPKFSGELGEFLSLLS